MAAQVGEPPTVATDETLSQPSTSAGTNEDAAMQDGEAEAEKDLSSDSDASIGWGDYEHRKDVIVKKLVVCEQMMARVKVTAKFTRLKDYDKRKDAIKNRSDSEYLARVAAMEREMQKERDKQETLFNLELAALDRANEGEIDFINRGYRDRLQYRKSQLIYDSKLKLNKILERVWKEDEVRADVRIFVGEDVPDEWLDDFVKSYVDELDERENGEEAVRQRNLKRYRMEACESLDSGQSLSGILDKAEAAGHWANRSSLLRLPKEVYNEEEKKRIERARRKHREKTMSERITNISHKKLGRFFGNNAQSPPSEMVVDDFNHSGDETIDALIDEEITVKGEETSKESEVVASVNRKRGMTTEEEEMIRRCQLVERLKDAKKQLEEEKGRVEDMRRKEEEKWRMKEEGLREWERGEKERQMRMWREKLEKVEADKSEESCSDEEKQDLASTVRQGVRAILFSHGRPSSVSSERDEKRVGRLKKTLRTMLDMKRQFGADPELKHAQSTLMSTFMSGARKERRGVNYRIDGEDEQRTEEGREMPIEGYVRDAALVNGLVKKSLERPIYGGVWLDREGKARGAVERERKRREVITSQYVALKKKVHEKKEKEGEKTSGWEDEKRGKKKNKKKIYEDNEIYVDEEEVTVNGKRSVEKELTEKERMDKEKRLREIRTVIQGGDPNVVQESPKDIEEDEVEVEILEEEEEKREFDGMMKTKKKKNGGTPKNPSMAYSSGSSEDEEVYGSVPAYRFASRPKPRMKLQLSQERILRDLYRSGALRQRESYGDHIERLDKERKQRILSSLASSSGDQLDNRVHLLSPRSRIAIEELPEEAIDRLTKKERRSLLDGLPSTSKECEYEEREGEEEESDEELSEGWELEEDQHEKKEDMKEEVEVEVDEELSSTSEEEYDSVDDEDEEEYEYEEEEVRVKEEEEEEEEMEEPRTEEMREESRPSSAVHTSPLLLESTTKKEKESTSRLNGYSRTGTTTVV